MYGRGPTSSSLTVCKLCFGSKCLLYVHIYTRHLGTHHRHEAVYHTLLGAANATVPALRHGHLDMSMLRLDPMIESNPSNDLSSIVPGPSPHGLGKSEHALFSQHEESLANNLILYVRSFFNGQCYVCVTMIGELSQ